MQPISFDRAALSLLDAAVDPAQWTTAMDTVAQYADATGAVLLQLRGRGPARRIPRRSAKGLRNISGTNGICATSASAAFRICGPPASPSIRISSRRTN